MRAPEFPTNLVSRGDFGYSAGACGTDNIIRMEQAVPRARLYWIAGAYAATLAVSAALIFARYIAYVTHPADVAAYGGMWAGGDLALEVIIIGMLLVVTFFVALAIFKYEAAYTTYSKVMVALSLTLPASVGFIAIPAVSQSNSLLGWAALYRVFAAPMMLMGFGMSRMLARFPKAKSLTNYALLIEGLTLVFMVVMLFGGTHLHLE